MIVGRIAVGIIILAIVIGIFYAYASLDELPDIAWHMVWLAVILLMAYCVGSGVYLLIEAGVV